MPEAVLAGANGQPAIDQMTGMPLTMEELLRRRGIMSVGGVNSPLNQAPTPQVDPGVQTIDNVTAGMQQGPSIPVPPGSMDADVDGDLKADVDKDGDGAPVVKTTLNNPTNNPDDGLPGWLLAIPAVAAAMYAAKKLRGGKSGGTKAGPASLDGGTDIAAASRGGDSEVGESGRGIVDAEFSEVGPENRLNGQKLLGLPAPANSNTASGDTLTSALADRSLPDLETRNARNRTRMQTGAAQANNSRVQPTGEAPLRLQDQFTDLSPAEMGVAKQLASRIRTDRVSGAAARGRGVKTAGRGAGLPAPAPVYDQGSELTEAVAMVRRLRASGVNTAELLPLIRQLR